MKTRYLIAVLVGTTAVAVGINCAPVDPPPATETPREAPPVQRAAEENRPRIEPPAKPLASGYAKPDALKQRIDAAIDQVRRRQIRTDNGFWTVFHGILGLGPSVKLHNPKNGEDLNALDHMASGREPRVPGVNFVPMPIPGESDGLDVETGPGTFVKQGHQDQFVAEMVEWGVSPTTKFVVKGKDYTFDDFLRYSKARASAKAPQELEWALVIIGTRYGTKAQWTNAAGEKVHFEDLVRAELEKEVDNAACGGTHLLFGLTWVYQLHLNEGGKTEGVWKDIADRIAMYKKRAREVQTGDGSFSTEFFRSRSNAPDLNLRMNTTGHIVEWLSLAMTKEELREPWMQAAVSSLAMMFLENERTGLEGGSMYHAVHGLLIYAARVYGPDTLPKELRPHMPLSPSERLDSEGGK